MRTTRFLIGTVVSVYLILLSACTKSYESAPLGQQTDISYVFDPLDSAGTYALAYLRETYLAALPDGHNRISGNYLDAASDDAISSSTSLSNVQKIATGAYTASQTNADDVWSSYYTAIRNATVFTVYINRVPLKELLPNGKSARPAYRSEARFLRARLYFELVKRYGGVPILGDTVRQIDNNIQLPRNTFEQCINYIVSELNDIKDSLRTQSMISGDQYGRVTKEAAMALKARVLLYAASPLFNGGNISSSALTGYTSYDINRWKLAADAAKEIINLGEFSLMPSFTSVFLTQAASVGTNTEKIFWKQDGYGTSVEVNNAPVGYTSAGGNGITSPTQNLVDAYPTDSGKSITDMGSGYDATQPYAHRDPRLAATIFYNGHLWLNRPVETFAGGVDRPGGTVQQTKTGYYMRKFMGDFESVNASSPVYSSVIHDWIYFRYAEVLLNYAEAVNEFSGPTSDAYDVLYKLRARAGIFPGTNSTYGVPQGMTQNQMRQAIRNERRIELAFEEHRYWDIRRWKIAEQVYNTASLQGLDIEKSSSGEIYYNLIPVLTTVFKAPKMYLYPIPYSEVIKNSNMQQNPGW